MDDKTLTGLSTTLALFQVQLNALMLLVDRYGPAGRVREDFQRLVSEGVATVGVETMKLIKNLIGRGLFNRIWKTLVERVKYMRSGLIAVSRTSRSVRASWSTVRFPAIGCSLAVGLFRTSEEEFSALSLEA